MTGPGTGRPDALADRLEETALASLPFGSGELAQALAEANAVRRGVQEEIHKSAVERLKSAVLKDLEASRDARIARAAEGLAGWKAALSPTEASPDFWAAWDRLVEAVEGPPGGEPEAPAAWLRPCPDCAGTGWAEEAGGGRECRHGRPLGEDCGSCDLVPQSAGQHQHELGLIAEAAARAKQASIRQMAEDRADDYAVDPSDDGPEEQARRLRRDTLLDFAALLAPEGGAE